MSLKFIQIKSARPKDKPYRLADGRGLYLTILSSGARYWHMRYKRNGREKLISLGVYPYVSLAQAREKAEEIRKMLANGTDPVSARKAGKKNRFADIAMNFLDGKENVWTPEYLKASRGILKRDIDPYIGDMPVARIRRPDILEIINRICARGSYSMAEKAKILCSQIFSTAVLMDLVEFNPVSDLNRIISKGSPKHYRFLALDQLGDFFLAMDKSRAYQTTKIATALLVITGLRTVEVRKARWCEIDFERRLWEIPPEKMKKRRTHLVPLSRQALALLRVMRQRYDGENDFIFPGTKAPYIGSTTIRDMIQRMGYQHLTNVHGTRHTFSTILNNFKESQNFHSDWIEMQLAHHSGGVRGVYNHALYIEERRRMMQWYADLIEAQYPVFWQKIIPSDSLQTRGQRFSDEDSFDTLADFLCALRDEERENWQIRDTDMVSVENPVL